MLLANFKRREIFLEHGQYGLTDTKIPKNYTWCLKKMSFLGKIAITTLKLIQNANVGGVLENSGYLLPYRH